MTELTQGRLKELLRYDPETGIFTRMVTTSTRVKVGSRAGGLTSLGYIGITVDGKEYRAHRLAWLYMTGAWPEQGVDHRDTNRANNRWSNLRVADKTTNGENRVRANGNSKSGLLGVCRYRKKWTATIQVGGVKKHLGCFPTPEEAHRAYVTAKRVMHAGCTI